jgi:hypothetical protein
MNKFSFTLLLAALITSQPSFSADKKLCEDLLGAGMYNAILEDVCNFNGGVKIKIIGIYNEAGCREILPQKIVDEIAKDVLIDTKGRYKAMGHNAFCNGNIDAYNALQD